MNTRKPIKDLKVGENIETVYLLRKKEMQKTKDNKPYLMLVFSDRTGMIEARMWDNAEDANSKVDAGSPVLVKGTVNSWKDNIQLKIDQISAVPAGEFKMDDLIRSVENIDEIFGSVKNYISEISNKWLKLLADQFLDDEQFMDRFKKAAGAKNWHNAYKGGLLEHTNEVMFIVDKVCGLYPQADRDLCLLGAFLHDIGKVLEIDSNTLEYTLEGGLIGHLPLGFEMVSDKINHMDGFPKDLASYVQHIILSHHGEYQQQSPVLPKTLEATIIYHADELVSQANAVKEIIQSQSDNIREWSNFVSIKNRKYLLKKKGV